MAWLDKSGNVSDIDLAKELTEEQIDFYGKLQAIRWKRRFSWLTLGVVIILTLSLFTPWFEWPEKSVIGLVDGIFIFNNQQVFKHYFEVNN